MMPTIRVRVNPHGTGEYVIYADPEDRPVPWLGQTGEGKYTGWFHNREVTNWPEFKLRLPGMCRDP